MPLSNPVSIAGLATEAYVQEFLNDLAQVVVTPVGISFEGDWAIGTPYSVGDWVGYDGDSYVALDSTTGNQPDVSPLHWYPLVINAPAGPVGPQGEKGDQGDPGAQGSAGADGQVGTTGEQGATGAQGATGSTGPSILNYIGVWDIATPYVAHDWVAYVTGGETLARAWFALKSDTGTTPGTDATVWALLAISGPIGPQGIQGVQGSTGSAGQTGATGPTGTVGPSGGGTLAGRLSAAINTSVSSMGVIINGEWPAIPSDVASFNVLVDNELMHVTACTAANGQGVSTFSVTRAHFGTALASHSKNAVVQLRQLIGAQGPAGPSALMGQLAWTFEGVVVAGVSKVTFDNFTGRTWTIIKAWVRASVAPTGAAIIADINLNGTTVFTNQAHRPQCAATVNVGTVTVFDVATVPDGGSLTCGLDQVGSSVAGDTVTVGIVYTY